MKRKHILYRDVADKLKEDIMSGRYPIGSFLPTETELEATFNVSKITVRKAIELLAADEYVEKRSGRGTTVLSNRPYNKHLQKYEAVLAHGIHEIRCHINIQLIEMLQILLTEQTVTDLRCQNPGKLL